LRSRPGLFRGSELPRLLLLASLLVVGWVAFLAWQSRHVEKPPPLEAQRDPLPPPDDRIEFHGVLDKAKLLPRETAAYKLLVDQVRETPLETLRSESRRDLVYSQFLDNPRRYRGLPVHIEGTARRTVAQSASGTAIWPRGEYFESFLFTGDSQHYPWWVAFEEVPEGLQLGDDLYQRVAFDGYFLKLIGYEAGDALRYAPLFIGRIRPVVEPPSSGAGNSGWPIAWWWVLALAALLAFGLLRWWIFARGAFRKASWRPTSTVPITDRIEPEDLNAWVEKQAEGDEHDPYRPDDDDSDGGLLVRR
jgi:hypothetical protein